MSVTTRAPDLRIVTDHASFARGMCGRMDDVDSMDFMDFMDAMDEPRHGERSMPSTESTSPMMPLSPAAQNFRRSPTTTASIRQLSE
jgi:hypothetical protein